MGRTRPAPAARPYGLMVQPKLALGPVHDRFEAEADRAADHVTSDRPGTPALSRVPAATGQRRADDTRGPDQQDLDDLPAPALQRRATGTIAPTGAPSVPRPVEAGVRAARGGGQALPAATRAGMETGFGRDLGGVRLHDDARAHRLNAALGAQAFTAGRDIFLSRGAPAADSPAGRHLLAHEIAHVAQQTGPGAAPRIQRTPDPGTTTTPEPPAKTYAGKDQAGIDISKKPYIITLPKLELPRYANSGLVKGQTPAEGFESQYLLPASGGFTWTGQGARNDNGNRSTDQTRKWERAVATHDSFGKALQDLLDKDQMGLKSGADEKPHFYLRHTANSLSDFALMGTKEQLLQDGGLLRPPYAPAGTKATMQVDHYNEVQLGGQDEVGNMWLLEAKKNRDAGDQIKTRALEAAKELVAEAETEERLWSSNGLTPPSFRSGSLYAWPEPKEVNFTFLKIESWAAGSAPSWLLSEIEAGKHLDQLQNFTRDEMRAAGLLAGQDAQDGGRVSRLAVFHSASAAKFKTLTVSEDNKLSHVQTSNDTLIAGLHVKTAEYTGAIDAPGGTQIGMLKGQVFVDKDGRRKGKITNTLRFTGAEEEDHIAVPILARDAPGIAGHFDDSAVAAAARKLKAPKAKLTSPLQFDNAHIDDDFVFRAGGSITADNPLFSGVRFDFGVEADGLFIDAILPTDQLSFGPFEVTEASLGLAMGAEGLAFRGAAAFRLGGVGEGDVTARGTALQGRFRFDLNAFDPAELEVTYADRVWNGKATLGIRPGVIPGVTGGSIDAELGAEGLSVAGSVDLGGPGLPPAASLQVSYSEDTGILAIGGRIEPDTSDMPGLTAAYLEMTVTRDADGGYSLTGAGGAQMQLAGLSGAVTLAYADGFIDATAAVRVNRPPMTGAAAFNLSNRPVDPDGQPIEGPPLPGFRVWGQGTASVQFGRYITGTVDIRFLENGELELAGTVALPPEITLIEPVVWRKQLLRFPEVRFPIIGLTIPVVNRSVGVFGFVGGGLDAALTVGPGKLVDTAVTVVYNPDHPEDAAITGHSAFVVTADAEIGLTVTGGIGAGLAVVEAVGEIGMRGALGLGLSGRAELDVGWTPQTGLDIGAAIEGEAQPRFSVSMIAAARVTADVRVWSGDLWSENWNTTLAEIGPDAVWGARLPMHWSERGGLDLSLDNLDLRRPPLDLRGLALEVFDRA